MRTIAVFDFDGTITTKDALLPFLIYLNGYFKTYIKLIPLIPYLLGFVCRIYERQCVKEKILTAFLKGWNIQELNDKGANFAKQKLDSLVRKKALERIHWHQKQGHECIIVSAAIENYIKPWGLNHGFQKVISSKLLIENDQVIGKLNGSNCWGKEKVKRLLEYLKQDRNYSLYMYGDSQGDIPLLEIADYAYYRVFN